VAELLLSLTQAIGSGFCTASEDGEKVHLLILEAIKKGDKVRLSFSKVEDLTSAFLNAAVGQLYGEFEEETLREHLLPPVDASPEDLALLKRVVEKAKAFFQDPERFRRAAEKELGDD
jgi:hypothetical protein